MSNYYGLEEHDFAEIATQNHTYVGVYVGTVELDIPFGTDTFLVLVPEHGGAYKRYIRADEIVAVTVRPGQ